MLARSCLMSCVRCGRGQPCHYEILPDGQHAKVLHTKTLWANIFWGTSFIPGMFPSKNKILAFSESPHIPALGMNSGRILFCT